MSVRVGVKGGSGKSVLWGGRLVVEDVKKTPRENGWGHPSSTVSTHEGHCRELVPVRPRQHIPVYNMGPTEGVVQTGVTGAGSGHTIG